jgi:FkbM family methyltransferase
MIIDVDSDRFVKEVIEGNEYSYLFKNLVVVDVGCNVGTFSLWIRKLAREIHAIDMVPEIIENFNETIKKNKIDNIKTYCIAITGSNLQRKYKKDPLLGWGASQIAEDGESLTNCATLRQFMDAHKIEHIDVLKLDVEGLEREILSASDFPKDKVSTIIGEVHADKDNRRIKVRGVLQEMGFSYIELVKMHFLARKIPKGRQVL